eukprot:scaffold30311_cov57-Phaeocystis_antarctica.AAC.2
MGRGWRGRGAGQGGGERRRGGPSQYRSPAPDHDPNPARDRAHLLSMRFHTVLSALTSSSL